MSVTTKSPTSVTGGFFSRLLASTLLHYSTIAAMTSDDCQTLDAPDYLPAGGAFSSQSIDMQGVAWPLEALRDGWRARK